MSARPIELDLAPEDVLLGWPRDRALVALWSGQAAAWSRWCVFAEPAEALTLGPGALGQLAARWGRPAPPPTGEGTPTPPFTSGWIGHLSYQLGREIEPNAAHRCAPLDDRAFPLALWHRCSGALVYDTHERRWWLTGDQPRHLVQQLTDAAARPFSVGAFQSRTGSRAYAAATRRIIDYIHAGDIFQANLAHRLSASFQGSARALFARLCALTRPWYGAYLEFPDAPHIPPHATHAPTHAPTHPRRAIVSISPELFLQLDPRTRRIVTRPMKGTRRAAVPAAHADLASSPKDIAELNMIIDLMRSDIGRVCELASVRVEDARLIERHADGSEPSPPPGQASAGVLQGVATISGTLRRDGSIAELLGATFPGGSVTGAPKIRAMQIIEELEPVARGPYCGCIGYVSDTGHAAFSIAIRTALLSGPPAPGAGDAYAPGATLDYSVGAGIVADSDPDAEWAETLDKAGAILSLAPSPGILP